MSQQLLTIADIASRLRISRRAVFTLVKQPDFPRRIVISTRVVRFNAGEVEEWVARRRSGATS